MGRRATAWTIAPEAIHRVRPHGRVGIRDTGDEMTETDILLKNNEAYAASFDKGDLPIPPGRRVAVLACMDARLDPARALGLDEGDAHVIRNAGGVVTDDALRSLAISQNLLGTEEIVLIHHTDCGMLTFTDEQFADKLEHATGSRPEWRAHAFSDLEQDVRDGIERIKASPFVPRTESVRGFVYEVETGRLREVG
jgi:carbonic anhydrase